MPNKTFNLQHVRADNKIVTSGSEQSRFTGHNETEWAVIMAGNTQQEEDGVCLL
ncbi:hypothetical protein [Sedimenticola selenatireducens]|uniref:hypothetical protein n=1 Tax=Sedimenticola selenatireducens TaxID=191960 RepID=UPI00164256ED|nr:hypothetical protein [Sedimenticola selenatireducens]